MEIGEITNLLNISTWLPIVALLLPLIVLLWNLVVRCTSWTKRLQIKLTLKGYFICLIAGVFTALMGLHYALLPFGGETVAVLSDGERFVGSLLKAVKVFGLDENFDQLILASQRMIKAYQCTDAHMGEAISILAGVLYVLAPILGGFGLVQILAGWFPGFRHWLTGFAFWKEKYYFSQLSDASLVLAESLSQVVQPVLIFTGVESVDGDGENAKQLLKAKALGAICLKKDLQHAGISCWGKRKFFLMDERTQDDGQVLRQLMDMTERKTCKRLRNAEVFLFVKSDAYVQVEKNLRKKLENQPELTEAQLPIILPVRCDFNLVGNLLADLPLFEPLIGKERKPDQTLDLKVTILGDSALATEMFLATYWIGQILDHKLHIRVCAEQTEKEFWSRIDRINPEIRQSVQENDPILKINAQEDRAEVYAQVEYCQCRMEVPKQFSDSDYFFIALGSDQENVAMADAVRRYVGRAHLAMVAEARRAGQKHFAPQNRKRTVITYVVRDQQLADTLNLEKKFSYTSKAADVYMQAVGSPREVYSIRNVFMLNHDRYAQASFDAYEAVQNRKNREKQQKDRCGDEYKYWANLARSLHLIYKVYSAGWLSASLFDEEEETKILQCRKQECQTARKKMLGKLDEKLLHRLAWLEHRRWNAFTRVKGYQQTQLYDVYGPLISSHKQMDLKLHPCLVECDQQGIRSAVTPEGKVEKKTETMLKDRDDYDLLDKLTYKLNQDKLYRGDLKYYDYPFESVKEDA